MCTFDYQLYLYQYNLCYYFMFYILYFIFVFQIQLIIYNKKYLYENDLFYNYFFMNITL